jgi:hypothetical protein
VPREALDALENLPKDAGCQMAFGQTRAAYPIRLLTECDDIYRC